MVDVSETSLVSVHVSFLDTESSDIEGMPVHQSTRMGGVCVTECWWTCMHVLVERRLDRAGKCVLLFC